MDWCWENWCWTSTLSKVLSDSSSLGEKWTSSKAFIHAFSLLQKENCIVSCFRGQTFGGILKIFKIMSLSNLQSSYMCLVSLVIVLKKMYLHVRSCFINRTRYIHFVFYMYVCNFYLNILFFFHQIWISYLRKKIVKDTFEFDVLFNIWYVDSKKVPESDLIYLDGKISWRCVWASVNSRIWKYSSC